MMAHPLALQLRNLQTLVEIAVDKNSIVVFPAPLMSTIQEVGAFHARETTASTPLAAVKEAHANGDAPSIVPSTLHDGAGCDGYRDRGGSCYRGLF